MIVLDTHVVSELMRPKPDERVVGWLASLPAASVYTTSITQAEILHGLQLLPAGRRRLALEAAAEAMFATDFGGRILAFGSEAALPYAQLASARRRGGRPISQFDAQIAAIAQATGAVLATRDAAGFAGCGVKLLDPWAE